MHLTPRTLGLAVAATVTACTVLGIMTSLDLASAHPNAHNAPATGPATAPASLAAGFRRFRRHGNADRVTAT
jgi:hypothetical protein